MSGNKEIIAQEINLYAIACRQAWNQLSEEEKMYVHFLDKHVWATFPISMKQCSVEAFDLFKAFLKTFKKTPVKELVEKAEVSEEAKAHFRNYCGQFFDNAGNYMSYGDSKFIPGCTKEEFVKIVSGCGENFFGDLIEIMYDESPRLLHYGLPPEACTAYYSENITKEEIDHVNELLTKKGMLLENTRIDKIDGKLVVGVASVIEKEEEYEDILIRWGWCKDELKKGVEQLEEVLKLDCVKNDPIKKGMFENYIKAFTEDYTKHKEAQRLWVNDKKPSVELITGFIEVYEDPVGVRGEWEAMVAVVDKEKTKELTDLVDNSAEIIATFPWGKDFEKDKFESPDFNSIDIIGFGTSGLPIGINLPNYGDIRMEGFKNVSLGNIMSAGNYAEKIEYIPEDQQEMFKKHAPRAIELQVAIHELLGHGSGKYFMERDGKKNFPEDLKSPFTGEPVKYYKEGETFESVFQEIGMPAEECRAESAGLYLTYNPKVAEIMKLHEDDQYVNWLSELRSGMLSVRYYNPQAKKWLQAHCQARFALYKTIEKSGAVRLENNIFYLDREKIPVAIEALKELLKKLQVYRATGDAQAMREFFIPLTTPSEEDLKFRDMLLEKKRKYMGYIQPNTKIVDGKVELIEYESSLEGIVQSYLDRFEF